MYRWLMRFAAAGAGTVLLTLVRALEWYPIFYIFPLALILLAFADSANDDDDKPPVADDVRRVVIKPDNRRWDFSDDECKRNPEMDKNKRIHKIVM